MKNQSQIYDVPQLCTESSNDIPANGSKLVVCADLHHSTKPPTAPPPAELEPVVYTEITGIWQLYTCSPGQPFYCCACMLMVYVTGVTCLNSAYS